MSLRVALTLVIVAAPAAADDVCVPRAQLSGDAQAVEKVTVELERLGVAIGGANAAGCPSVDAAVEIERDGFAVAVRDSSHRSEGRVVGNAAIAAAWIDSWLHDDALDPWRAAAPGPRVAAAPGETPIAARVAVEPVHDTSIVDRLSLEAGYEQTWTNDGNTMQGVGVAACIKLGALCIGGRAHYASTDLTGATRTDTSLLATVSTTVRVGSMRVEPEIGLGLGRMTTTRVDGCVPADMNMLPPNCDPTTDPTCVMPPAACNDPTANKLGVYVGDGFSASTYTPRASAALRLALPVFSRVWLVGFAAVSATAFAHGDAFVPATAPMGVTPGDIALPGEPDLAYQLGVGVRVEVP